jgi:hypothetical protein
LFEIDTFQKYVNSLILLFSSFQITCLLGRHQFENHLKNEGPTQKRYKRVPALFHLIQLIIHLERNITAYKAPSKEVIHVGVAILGTKPCKVPPHRYHFLGGMIILLDSKTKIT